MLVPPDNTKFAVGGEASMDARLLVCAHIVLHNPAALGVVEALDDERSRADDGFFVQRGEPNWVILKLHVVEIQELGFESGGLVFGDHLFYEPLRGKIFRFDTVEIDDGEFVFKVARQKDSVRTKGATAA